jgi:protein-L-isoaspartate(D-aspartate) O-methyltransferase
MIVGSHFFLTVVVIGLALASGWFVSEFRSNQAAPAPQINLGNPDARQDTFAMQREQMVTQQLVETGPLNRSPIRAANVLEAMRAVPRERFVPLEAEHLAYGDHPLGIGYQQTISQPYMVAAMTELAEVTTASRVLEIGTGSGYQAAVLAEITAEVYTIEIVEPLAIMAEDTLAELNYNNVTVKAGDGYLGWPEHAPFDAIIVTAAPPRVPQPLIDQLAVGGRLVIPVGERNGAQELIVGIKQEDGTLERRRVMGVRFVPFTGEHINKPK